MDEVSEEYLLEIRREKASRELDRIRNSFSFRIGTIIARCIKFPPLLILLPFWLIFFCAKYILERLGRLPLNRINSEKIILNPKRCVVLFPTNGVGLGHFTRLFAVARQIRKKDPDVEIVFVTTMSALHLVESEGFASYHLPGRYMFNDMTAAEWNAITEEILGTVFEIHRPSIFVFDGAYPYRGMLNSINNRKGLTNFWLRRGTFKKDGTKIPVDSIQHFHRIIRPTDSTYRPEEEIDHKTPIKTVNPIRLLQTTDLDTRDVARTRLGITEDNLSVYVQLGAGKINDIESLLQKVVDVLNRHENVEIVIGESIIGKRIDVTGDRIRVVRDYPNSKSFNGFDFAIMAGGYNSYHEAISFALPTIFIPNTSTGMDDQVARVKSGEEIGCCKVILEPNDSNIKRAIDYLMIEENRKSMKSHCKEQKISNGATEVAELIIQTLD